MNGMVRRQYNLLLSSPKGLEYVPSIFGPLQHQVLPRNASQLLMDFPASFPWHEATSMSSIFGTPSQHLATSKNTSRLWTTWISFRRQETLQNRSRRYKIFVRKNGRHWNFDWYDYPPSQLKVSFKENVAVRTIRYKIFPISEFSLFKYFCENIHAIIPVKFIIEW